MTPPVLLSTSVLLLVEPTDASPGVKVCCTVHNAPLGLCGTCVVLLFELDVFEEVLLVALLLLLLLEEELFEVPLVVAGGFV